VANRLRCGRGSECDNERVVGGCQQTEGDKGDVDPGAGSC
jgi:hypothetical protein